MKIIDRINSALESRKLHRRTTMYVRPIQSLDKTIASGEKYMEETAVKTALLFVSSLAGAVAAGAKDKALKGKTGQQQQVNNANQRQSYYNNTNNNNSGNFFQSSRSGYNNGYSQSAPPPADYPYGNGPMY